MSKTNNSQTNDMDAFLQMVRAAPGPAQRSIDIARQLVSEPTEAVLTTLVKDEFELRDDQA